jgi:RND family efflux transporter MFP subunit
MSKAKRRFFQLVIVMAFLAVGFLGFKALTASREELKKEKPPVPLPVVQTMQVNTGKKTVIIRGEGTVRPLRQINLVPQVGGEIIFISDALVNGGSFRKGDILLRIEPVDYELAVKLAEAAISDGESLFEIAEEEAAAAKEEWRIHFGNEAGVAEEPPPLVAKEPQLAAARARLDAARADLRKARLNLERTELKAPFNGRVIQKMVDIGQYVSPGQAAASLFSTEAAEIFVPLEDKNLYWFDVPGFTPGAGSPPPAVVKARIAGRDRSWQGRVVRSEGKLDEQTRMINVVVRVDRPYAEKPPLAVGLFVSVDIEGRTLPQAATIPRKALRANQRVWVVDGENRMRFRRVEVAKIQGEEVLIASGLDHDEQVVVSLLKAATDGMAVRPVPVDEAPSS